MLHDVIVDWLVLLVYLLVYMFIRWSSVCYSVHLFIGFLFHFLFMLLFVGFFASAFIQLSSRLVLWFFCRLGYMQTFVGCTSTCFLFIRVFFRLFVCFLSWGWCLSVCLLFIRSTVCSLVTSFVCLPTPFCFFMVYLSEISVGP